MPTSPHTHWKGCPMCKMHKHRGKRGSFKEAARVLRQFGVKRRFGRRPVE